MSKRDYYEILGIDRDATDSDIKRAYRQAAKKYHPDLNPNDPKAEEKFKEASEAYQVLSDPEKRSSYDRFGHSGADGQGFGGFDFSDFGFGGLDDLFGDLFGGMGSSRSRRRGPTRGSDRRYDLTITFEEAAFGTEKEIQVLRLEDCSRCKGTGAKEGSQPVTCTECNGTGEVSYAQNTAFGRFVNVSTCPTCNGEGTIISDPCDRCSGKGKVRIRRRISVKIPAGINNDQIITLRGEGDIGDKGGPPGDLYVYINVKPHKLFRRDGYDIHCEVPITFTEAALGAEIEIPTLEGTEKFQIPEGTQTGRTFNLKNRGISHIRGSSRGNQYITVKVMIPRRLNDRQKELLRELDKELSGKEYHEDRKTFFDKVKDAFGR
ncbi:MAG: molecular chaperone DnaJ [Clostridiales bacterium]|nr:molecular chaperone DnaJ [Clostridiales bacterium]